MNVQKLACTWPNHTVHVYMACTRLITKLHEQTETGSLKHGSGVKLASCQIMQRTCDIADDSQGSLEWIQTMIFVLTDRMWGESSPAPFCEPYGSTERCVCVRLCINE